MEEQQQEQQDDSEEIPPKGWKELMDYKEREHILTDYDSELEMIGIKTFITRWMEHPKKEHFINWKDDFGGNTMLISAIVMNRWDIVKVLIDHGADVTAANEDGETALMEASRYGHSEIVKRLVRKGADVNIANEHGMTALILASREGNNETVKLLVEMGADVTAVNNDGMTALNWAYRKGHIEIVKFLLQQPQQQQQREDEEIPPTDWEWLIENRRKELKNVDVETFQKHFMEHPKKERFINWKSDDSSMGNGNTMLSLAIEAKRFDIGKLLLDHGADANNIDNDGDTPLMYASQNGHNETVNLLVVKGADITVANKNGMTAFMWASLHGHSETVKLLLEMGAHISAVNCHGENALSMASRKGHSEIVALFMEKGETEELPPKDWKELIDHNNNETLKKVDIEMFQKQFMEHPKKERFIDWQSDDIEDGNTMLISAIAANRWDIVKVLLDHGADVNIAEKSGWTALMWAASQGHNETVKRLLEMGADVTAANKRGTTALNWAYRKGHNEIVKLLLQQPQQQQQRQDEEIPPTDWKWLIENRKTKMKNIDLETFKKQFMEHPQKESFINWKSAYSGMGNGNTMLSLVIHYERFDIGKLLLDHGADANNIDNDGDTPLLYASQNGHNETVNLLVEMGSDVTAVNCQGENALMLASQHGHSETVKLLLEKGADVTAANKNGLTALTIASQYGHDEIVKLLLEKGADVTAVDKDVNIALVYASLNGHNETVKLLLEKCADVTAVDKDGDTALIVASQNGHSETVKLLLEKGADITAVDTDGWTVFMEASENGHNETVKLLLEKGADVTAADTDGGTALMYASHNGHDETVKLLLEKGADVTAADTDGGTALMYASQIGHDETVKLLLEKGADVTAANKNGRTALMYASRYGHDEIVKLLLEKGADVTAVDEDGHTALVFAFENGHNETMKLLLEMGADVTATVNKDGKTMLMWASLDGHNETVKLLLEKGADVTATDNIGRTALSWAYCTGRNEIVKFLLQQPQQQQQREDEEMPPEDWKWVMFPKSAEEFETSEEEFEKIDIEMFQKQFMEHPKKEHFINWKDDDSRVYGFGKTMLCCAILYKRYDIAKLLLDHGADFNIPDKDGMTALMYASLNGHNETVKLLLEKGADVTAANKNGKTALIVATEKGHNETMKQLLAKIIKDPNISNKNGQTLLHLACLHNKRVDAQKLLEIGTDKDILDKNGHTALYYAAEKGYAEIVDLLMKHHANGNKTDRRRVGQRFDSIQDYTFFYYIVDDGRTPLFIAAENGHQNVVAVLLQHGADPYLCNHESKIPRDVSKVHGPIQQLFRIHDFFDKRDKGRASGNRYMTCIDNYYDCDQYKGNVALLENIIHDIVKYPHFADKFFELYQENREMVNWLDQDGRTVRQVACKECREVTLFMGRYDMEVQPMYESPTCKIYKGLDYGGPDEQLKQPRPVVMKMMENEEHYLNEVQARRKDDGSPRFSSEFVTPYLAVYRADEHPEFAKAREMWNANESEKNNLYGFLIIMEQGGRNLMESMNAENLSAEHKDLQRREILLNLVVVFVYLHEVGYIHGDIKPHNVVRHMGDSVTSWKAIDFDACTKIGDVVGLKLTTGSAPPEMLKIVNGEDAWLDKEPNGKPKVILRQPGGDLDKCDLVLADPSFDVWSFGILMYQLVTGRSFFHSDLQGNVNEEGLQELVNLTQDLIHMKLEGVTDANAKVVLQNILRLDPTDRPTMSKIEEYPFFHPSKESDPQGPSTLEYTSAAQVVPKSVTKLTIGKDLEQIAKGVCSGNGQLEEVDTSKAHSLEVVGEKAFSSCRALEEFQCPSSVKAIGLEAFHECVKLQDFMFSKAQALESIGDRAFYDCRALMMFKCPLHVKVIGKHAFHGCKSLRDVDLSEAHALEMIEGRAFSFCSAVQKVLIPENVTVVGEGFLDECGALESLVIAGENPILHINVLLRIPEPKRELVAMDSIVEMYSNNPVKTSELSGESSKVASLLQEVKEGYVKSIKTSDDPIRKISKRDGWVEFLSAHAHDSKEDCIQKLISFLESEASIGVVRMLADATDRLGRVAKMIAPEHIRKVFEKRLFFLGRYDIAKGPPIHKSATCVVMKAMDAQMSNYYKEMFEEFVQEKNNTVDKEEFTEILQNMKLISYDERNIKELFDKVDVDKSGTVSKAEFVDFCTAELGHDVVLKFMRNKDQYRRELNGRDGLDPRFVVGCIRNHDTSTNPELIKSLQDTMQSQEEGSGEIRDMTDDIPMNDYCYVIVMPFGDRNLATISQSERPGSLAVRKMMQEVGEALCHLHEKGIVHGDLKMLNVVRSNGRLSLIDLDASGRVGKDFMGSKFSSGVVPPEMLYELKNVKELNAYKDYVDKGASKGEKAKREAVFTRDMVDRECFVVRSFWEKEVVEETNDEWTGETLTTVKSYPILDGLPYSTAVHGSDNDGEGSNVLVRASPSFDVWSFGVLLYRLLTRDPLFHVNDEDDIKKGDEMKKLYQWSDNDLKSAIERDVADPYAKLLLQNVLRSNPTERWTMAEVLNDDYFKVDSVKNMSEFQETLSRIEKISLDNYHLMRREFARVHSSLQQIQRFQAEANKFLQQIIDGEDVPRYFIISPLADSFNESPNKNSKNTMTFGGFFKVVKDGTNPDTYINERARLIFICPLSLQPVVDASGQAVGFDILVPRDWVRKFGPALLIGMKVAQVAMSVGRCFGLPLPSLSGAEDALAERSEILSKLQEMVVSGLGNEEDEDEEGGTIADSLISSLTDKLEESVSNDVKTSKMIRERLQESYSGIEELIGDKNDISDCGLIKARHEGKLPEECVSEYVHPEWKDVFVKLGRKSLEMSIEELEIEKAKLDSLSTTVSSSTEVEFRHVSSEILPKTEGASEATEKPGLGTATANRGSRSPVYADELVEEVSMTDSNIPELPNRPASDRLYGKLDNMERKLDKMDDMEHKLESKLDKVLQNQQGASPTSSTTVENKVVIFHGWLSKQSREHSLLWQDRYFEIFNDGDVAYYPKGVRRGDLGYGVKLFKSVKWSKIDSAEHKLELKSQDMFVLGRVKQSSMNTDSTIDEWMKKGNSWRIIESPPSSGADLKDTKSTSSKPRSRVAQTAADGSIIRR